MIFSPPLSKIMWQKWSKCILQANMSSWWIITKGEAILLVDVGETPIKCLIPSIRMCEKQALTGRESMFLVQLRWVRARKTAEASHYWFIFQCWYPSIIDSVNQEQTRQLKMSDSTKWASPENTVVLDYWCVLWNRIRWPPSISPLKLLQQ